MKKILVLLGAISLTVYAMDNEQKNIISIVKKMQELDTIKFIEISSNASVYTDYNQKMICDLCNIYRWYFEDIQRRDLIFCHHTSFNLRKPSFYLKQFQEKQFCVIKNQVASLKGIWFFFLSREYAQMDKHFATLYQQHKDVKKTWDEFITYFLSEYVVDPIIRKKYSKMPLVVGTL